MRRWGSALIERFLGAVALRPEETTEEQRWGTFQAFPGRVVVEESEEAFRTATTARRPRYFLDGRITAR